MYNNYNIPKTSELQELFVNGGHSELISFAKKKIVRFIFAIVLITRNLL